MDPLGYPWHPIELLPDPAALAVDEMRAFTKLWKRQRERLSDSEALRRFQERMNRWWSIETGVIERIYDISEGATRLLIEHGFVAGLVAHGETNIDPDLLVEILGDHRQALDMVMDVVGGARPLTTGWIKELHALTTRNQDTSTAVTSGGQHVAVALLHGEYKRVPNSPRRADGLVHEYCPPEQVASEMDRLVDIYNGMPVEYPEVRAAWLHHAFTQIHPFQGGNGRVARALASVDFIRAGLFPLVVPRTERAHYLDALGKADGGDLGPLIDFFSKAMERILTRAISEAESALGEAESLNTVIAAARAKIAARERSDDDLSRMRARSAPLAEAARGHLETLAARVQDQVPKVTAVVQLVAPSEQRAEELFLMGLVQRHGYLIDVQEAWSWVRLVLTNGGRTAINVVLPFVGNPSPGTCIAVIYLSRVPSSDEASAPLVDLAIEPLLLVPDEDEAAQRGRFLKWLDESMVQALAQWTRFL